MSFGRLAMVIGLLAISLLYVPLGAVSLVMTAMGGEPLMSWPLGLGSLVLGLLAWRRAALVRAHAVARTDA